MHRTAMHLLRPYGRDELPDFMARSFFAMRWGLVGIAVALPLVLLVGGRIAAPHHPQPESISSYYHTAMRNVFVGAVVAIGVLLLLYRAFNRAENLLLNVAGAAAVGVALIAPDPDRGATDGATHGYWEHVACALVLFVIIGVIAVFFAADTVALIPDERQRRRFRVAYRALGVAMIVAPLIALVAALAGWGSIFWVETAAVYVFAGYWLTKTVEFRRTQAETKAVHGTLTLPQRTVTHGSLPQGDGRVDL